MNSKKEQFIDLMQKVEHEGGWGPMVNYGDPPNIEKFPELQEAWKNFSDSYLTLLNQVENHSKNLDVDFYEWWG